MNILMKMLLEDEVLSFFEKMTWSEYYDITEVVDIKEQLEFVNNESLLVLSFNVIAHNNIEDDGVSYLVIVIEKDRIVYLLVDNNLSVINQFIIKEEDVLNYCN